jgi:hypothetical protein
MPAARILFAFLPLFAAAALAQKTALLTTPDRTRLETSQKRLDTDYTDWVLLLDIGEKAAVLAPASRELVADTAAAAKGRGDGRYYLRLLGVLARIDPEQGTARLAEAIASSEQAKAALAARVLGRSGAPPERVAAVIGARLPQEKRKGMAGALALAAADAGAAGVVKVLRERLTNSRLDRTSQLAVATALAQLVGPEAKKEAAGWLKADSPLLAAGILLARRWHDVKAEPALLALHAATTDDRDLAQWLAQTLGAVGGDATRKAFRSALDAEARGEADPGIAAMSSDLDPRLLALLRLHEDKAVAAVRSLIGGAAAGGRTATTPAVARLPELFGKWNAPGAVDLLAGVAADESAPALVRAYAARGLCWRRELRGLEAAAAILARKEHANEPALAEGLTAAQQVLHEFTADGDRPDYVLVDRGNEAAAVAVGEAWQQWLGQHAGKVTWREPPPNVDELLFWY